jgi:hypothetical protein
MIISRCWYKHFGTVWPKMKRSIHSKMSCRKQASSEAITSNPDSINLEDLTTRTFKELKNAIISAANDQMEKTSLQGILFYWFLDVCR